MTYTIQPNLSDYASQRHLSSCTGDENLPDVDYRWFEEHSFHGVVCCSFWNLTFNTSFDSVTIKH